MEVGEADKQQAVIYLTVLVVLELLLFLFVIASAQQAIMMLNIMRILLLLGAHCLKNITWAAYYTIFALITAFLVVDPVGLWITGRTQCPIKMEKHIRKHRMRLLSSSSWDASQQ
jgi:hypothetical protein